MYLYRLQPEAENKSEICRNIEKNMCKNWRLKKSNEFNGKKCIQSLLP